MRKNKINTLNQENEPDGTARKLESELLPRTKLLGKQHGLQNKPTTETEFRVRALKGIVHDVQQAIEENYAKYMPASMRERIRQIEDERNKQVAKLQAEHNEIEERHGALARVLAHLNKPSEKRWMRTVQWGIKASIILAETAMSYPALRNMNLPVTGAACASFGVGLLAAAGVHWGAPYIKEAPTRRKYYLRFGAIQAVATAAFTGLGFARANAFNQVYDLSPVSSLVNIPHASAPAWLFTLVSAAFFCGALFVGVRTCKTKAEEATDDAYWELQDQVQEAANAMQMKKDAMQATEDTANKAIASIQADFESGASIERNLIVVAHKAENAYVQANITHRPDGKFPDFFATPVQFNFRTYFNNQTNKNLQ